MALSIHKKSGRSSLSGFTLIEMTIVLVIVLAFLAMSLPFFANFSSATGINIASREITTILRTARSHAITKNKDYDAVFDGVVIPNRFWIQYYDESYPPVVQMEGKGLVLPSGMTFSASATITFVSCGGLKNGSATSVTITNNKGRTKTISVNSATGSVEIQ